MPPSDPTAPIEALRGRLPPGWTLRYGVREAREPTHMYVHWIDVTTLTGATFHAEMAITEALLANSWAPRDETERLVWERLVAEFSGRYPGVFGAPDPCAGDGDARE